MSRPESQVATSFLSSVASTQVVTSFFQVATSFLGLLLLHVLILGYDLYFQLQPIFLVLTAIPGSDLQMMLRP